MPEADGKGARVTGFSIFLVGAGVILDSSADWLGAAVAVGGAALLSWGLLSARTGRGVLPSASSEGA